MNYKKLVPEDSFIGQYLEYMSVVETAEAYDFWCALWAIGVESGRVVYVDRPNSPVYLNWYIILAAESGTTRKSTAVSAITRLLSRDGSMLLTGKTSPESLELMLHERSRQCKESAITFSVSELVTILGREGYMSAMPGLLTDLYDSPKLRTSPGTLKTGPLEQDLLRVLYLFKKNLESDQLLGPRNEMTETQLDLVNYLDQLPTKQKILDQSKYLKEGLKSLPVGTTHELLITIRSKHPSKQEKMTILYDVLHVSALMMER